MRFALLSSGFDPRSLIIEITETAIMRDMAAAIPRLAALKAIGIRIAIDDFGTGYSSLAYLQQFPVDTLKIDRSFISSMASSPESAVLIHTLVQLGKTLGLETLAEGIEGPEAVRAARARGVRQRAGVSLRPAARRRCGAALSRRPWTFPRAGPGEQGNVGGHCGRTRREAIAQIRGQIVDISTHRGPLVSRHDRNGRVRT